MIKFERCLNTGIGVDMYRDEPAALAYLSRMADGVQTLRDNSSDEPFGV